VAARHAFIDAGGRAATAGLARKHLAATFLHGKNHNFFICFNDLPLILAGRPKMRQHPVESD